MHYHQFDIRGYKIVLIGDENGLSRLMIDNNTKPIHIDRNWQKSRDLFTDTEQQLIEYFEGKRTEFNLKLNPEGTDFQKKVWQILSQIPYGKRLTYKQVAEITGDPNASRAVGLANNKNPIPVIIPCHRVVGAKNQLIGYAYGLPMKQRLLDQEKINLVFSKLANFYKDIYRDGWGGKKSWWPADSAFEMMAGAILTQNTNWKNVEKALTNLGDKLQPRFILESSNEELAELIRPSGYHNQKALKLKALCTWFEKYDFDIEKATKAEKETLREELLQIKGVGKETADSILVYALNKTSFVIDAYTRRIFDRLGFNVPADYDEFRNIFEQSVPGNIKTYDYYHGLIVEHAKQFCTKIPQCRECPLHSICEKKESAIQSKMMI